MQTRTAVALVALAATGIVLTFATSALTSTNQHVPVNGTVSAINVGVYTDSECTVNCTSISAGTITPGSTKTYAVHIKNAGFVPVILSMTTSSWNPATANGPITLTWNRDNYNLAAGSSVSATLTLTVSESISNSITAFNLNVEIIGTD